MPLYKNKYRTQTTRLAGWDYASQGYYYITICTQDREHFFGHVEGGEMWLTALGNEARKCWNAIPHHFPFVELDAFVIMPDHMHGVLYIDRGDEEKRGAMNRAYTSGEKGGATGMHNPMLSKSLGRVVRWYKGRTTYEIRRLGPGRGLGRGLDRGIDAIHRVSPPAVSSFSWQSRYYDHIVRSEADLDRIRTYIHNNPAHWGRETDFDDGEYPVNNEEMIYE